MVDTGQENIKPQEKRLDAKENASRLIGMFQTTLQHLPESRNEYKRMKQEKRSGFTFKRGNVNYNVSFGYNGEKVVNMNFNSISAYGQDGEHGRFKKAVELNVAEDNGHNDKFFPAIRYSVIKLGDSDDMHLKADSTSDSEAIPSVEKLLNNMKLPV